MTACLRGWGFLWWWLYHNWMDETFCPIGCQCCTSPCSKLILFLRKMEAKVPSRALPVVNLPQRCPSHETVRTALITPAQGHTGVIGLCVSQRKVPSSPRHGGVLKVLCGCPASVEAASGGQRARCPPHPPQPHHPSLPPRFINNPAKLVDLEGQWEAGLPVYIPSPGYNP